MGRDSHRYSAWVPYLLVTNPESGSGPMEDIDERARRELDDVEVLRLGQDDVAAGIDRAVSEGRVVVVLGGDGTVCSIVQHLAGTEGTLGVLPGGTLNHFARDLGVRDMDAAFETLRTGTVHTVDVGRMGTAYFVNGASLGVYPEIVEERERWEDRIGKWPAAALAAFKVMKRSRPLEGVVTADGESKLLYAWVAGVTNNRPGAALGTNASRERLDEGLLELQLLIAGRRSTSRAYFAWRVMRDKPWKVGRTVRKVAQRVDFELEGGARQVARDGEAEEHLSSVTFEVCAGALRVLVPAA